MRAADEANRIATQLSARADLVRRARALELGLSSVLESALERAVSDAERARWLAENSGAIDEYNAHIAKRGVSSDASRRF